MRVRAGSLAYVHLLGCRQVPKVTVCRADVSQSRQRNDHSSRSTERQSEEREGMSSEGQNAPKVRMVQIAADQAGQRLDNYLLRELKGVPRSHIYRLLRRGEVRVNKGRVRADYRLCVGDQVRVPPVRTAQRSEASIPAQQYARLTQAMVYQDERFLVLDKPSGLAVHGGSGVAFGVIDILRQHRPQEYVELVHRLDRETSGCLLLARNRTALKAAQQALHAGEKHYLTLVQGTWRGGRRQISQPLRRHGHWSGPRPVMSDDEGKAARSEFAPLQNLPSATLMQVRIDTGRTHQIRVHAAEQGHPIAGDSRYGDRAFNRHVRTLGLRRLFLHAHRLHLPELDLDVSAPLAVELREVLDRLETGG